MSSTVAFSFVGPSPEEVALHLPLDGLSGVPEFLCEVAAKYGPLAAIDVGERRYVLVSDPALIREVLVTKAASFRKGRDAIYDLARDGLFTSDGNNHADQRRAVQPVLHAAQDTQFEKGILAHTRAFASARHGDQILDVGREMRRLALAIGADTLFSVALDDRDDKIGAALSLVMAEAGRGIFGGLRYSDSIAALRSFERAKTYLRAIAVEVIAQSRHMTSPVAGALLTAKREDEKRDRVLTLLLAAQESTAIALTWALWLLARDRHIQEALRIQTDRALGTRKIRPEDVPRLGYATAVFREVLRLYPPAWIIGRRARLPVELGGVTFPRGTALFLSPYVTHRSEVYYRNPTCFDPERWMHDFSDRQAFSYLPFGAGDRSCVGDRFASIEGALILAELVRWFDFSLVDDLPIKPEPLLTLRPQRVLLRATSRIR